jgi:glycerol-3-phosphate cytidylyltransferase-like family protein
MAKKFGDLLLVIVNNDKQRELKGSKKFMQEEERLTIIKELKVVNDALLSIDNDSTVSKTLERISNKYSKTNKLYFANGGDQTNDNIPESNTCKKFNIILIDGLGDKIQSSSWLLNTKKDEN